MTAEQITLKIAKAIQDSQCILYVGPAICRHKQTREPIQKSFAKYLSEEIFNRTQNNPTNEENLTYIAQKYNNITSKLPENQIFDHSDAQKKAQEYYTNFIDEEYELIKNIANLPFKLIVNVNPDEIISKVFKANTKVHPTVITSAYYVQNDVKLTNEKENQFRIQIEKELEKRNVPTVVYNIYGSLQEPNSVPLTERDYIFITKSYLNNNSASLAYINGRIEEAKMHLFIGFDYKHWQFKFLFDALNFGKKKKDNSENSDLDKNVFSIYSSDLPVNEIDKDFFEQEFKFCFHREDSVAFTNRILETYQKLPPKSVDKAQKVLLITSLGSSEDEKLYKKIETMCLPYQNKKLLRPVSNSFMPASTDEEGKKNWYKSEIASSSVIMPLLSSDLLIDPDFTIFDECMKEHINANPTNKQKIRPILLRACAHHLFYPKDEYDLLPQKPDEINYLSTLEDIDLAIFDIITEILKKT